MHFNAKEKKNLEKIRCSFMTFYEQFVPIVVWVSNSTKQLQRQHFLLFFGFLKQKTVTGVTQLFELDQEILIHSIFFYNVELILYKYEYICV